MTDSHYHRALAKLKLTKLPGLPKAQPRPWEIEAQPIKSHSVAFGAMAFLEEAEALEARANSFDPKLFTWTETPSAAYATDGHWIFKRQIGWQGRFCFARARTSDISIGVPWDHQPSSIWTPILDPQKHPPPELVQLSPDASCEISDSYLLLINRDQKRITFSRAESIVLMDALVRRYQVRDHQSARG